MKRIVTALTTTAIITFLAGPARAEGGLGVGASFTLTGVDGLSVTYDADQFHVDGIFGLVDINDSFLALGGRFFYTVDSRAGADLSLGGGFTLANDGAADDTDFHFEVGAKIRVFLVPNVSFHTTLGLGLILDDDDDGQDLLVLAGQALADFGITYYFQ